MFAMSEKIVFELIEVEKSPKINLIDKTVTIRDLISRTCFFFSSFSSQYIYNAIKK